VEGVEYEAVLMTDLPATSELKAQSEAVCVADSFRDSSAHAQGLCCSVAASKSKSSKIFVFKGPVALKPIVAIFPAALPGMHYQRVQILRNASLRAYSATANALFLLRSSASVVP
jgi:hypothetical protein